MQHLPGLRSTLDSLRDRFAPVRHTSTFRKTGEITPEEFLLAGDYLVHKFPSWAWSPAGSAAKQVSYLPKEKQYLVTKHVPCNRRVNGGDFVGGEEKLIFLGGADGEGKEGDGDEWVSTGGTSAATSSSNAAAAALARAKAAAGGTAGQGRTVQPAEEDEDEEEIPDMDASDDEAAVIREQHDPGTGSGPSRTYNLYITYTPYYRTPRLYLSGFNSQHTPLPPTQMLEDIVGDYSEKTVTLEDFPFFDSPIKMASVHPCRHAAVMKVLLERADAAVKLRRDRQKEKDKGHRAESDKEKAAVAASVAGAAGPGLEGIVEGVSGLDVKDKEKEKEGDEWEVLQADDGDIGGPGEGPSEEEAAIQVHQYVVVFLKFMASVTPGIEHDFTMGV